MKVRITGKGIYGADGMVPVGTEVEVQAVPAAWAGRCEVVGGKGKTMVVNPATEDDEEVELSKAELIERAEELGIEVKNSWTKVRLLEEIEAAEAE